MSNSSYGVEILQSKEIIVQLFNILKEESSILKKSALWILAKILSNNENSILDNKYQIFEKISDLYFETKDYCLKGTICYIMSYLYNFNSLKFRLDVSKWGYFNCTSIVYPKENFLGYFTTREEVKKSKLNEKMMINESKINKIHLDSDSQEIYDNVCMILNAITYKQAYPKLKEFHKSNHESLKNINLLIKIIYLLNSYRFMQPSRHFMFTLIENGIQNMHIMNEIIKTLELKKIHLP